MFKKIFVLILIIFQLSVVLIEAKNRTKLFTYSKIEQSIQLKIGYETVTILKTLSDNNLSRTRCLSECSINWNCSFVLYSTKQCLVLNDKANNYLVPSAISSTNIIFRKEKINLNYVNTTGLQNYWPFNNNAKDVIRSADLYGGQAHQFVPDRFGKQFGAVGFNLGFYQVPAGVYFTGRFSVIAWDNVVCSLDQGGNALPFLANFIGSTETATVSNDPLRVGIWQHLACIYDGSMGYIYIDGRVTRSTSISSVNSVIRSNNYVGKSNWAGQSLADADIDELKIFNRALNQQELLFEMNNNMFI